MGNYLDPFDMLDSTASRMYGVLAHVASLGVGSTIEYAPLCDLVGLDPSVPSKRNDLGVCLDKIGTLTLSEYDFGLSALAVSKTTQMPSGRRDETDLTGWYAWAEENGLSAVYSIPRWDAIVWEHQHLAWEFFRP